VSCTTKYVAWEVHPATAIACVREGGGRLMTPAILPLPLRDAETPPALLLSAPDARDSNGRIGGNRWTVSPE
jgi:hypothetical protein